MCCNLAEKTMRLFLVFCLLPLFLSAQEICGTSYDSVVYNLPTFFTEPEWKEIPVVVHICYSDSLGDGS